jgi:hypothetical protein
MRPAKVFRGSRKRIRAIRWRGNGSPGLWLMLIWVLFLLFILVPWMVRHDR